MIGLDDADLSVLGNADGLAHVGDVAHQVVRVTLPEVGGLLEDVDFVFQAFDAVALLRDQRAEVFKLPGFELAADCVEGVVGHFWLRSEYGAKYHICDTRCQRIFDICFEFVCQNKSPHCRGL